MKDILVILPTRERSEKVKMAIEGWRNTTEGYSNLLLCVDRDDPQAEEYKNLWEKDMIISLGEPIKMCPTVNRAIKLYPDYKYYAFIGDDHVFRTNWETPMMDAVGKMGIAYGNDLLQGERLATHCLMTSNITKKIGYMVIPGLIHLYMDNFWMELGRGANCLHYLPDVVVEHMHPGAGKSVMDGRYQIVNSTDVYNHDKQVFDNWMSYQKDIDIRCLLTK